jgi:hypothetical protein
MRHLKSMLAVSALLAAACSGSDSVTDNRTLIGLELSLTPTVDTLILGTAVDTSTTQLVARATVQNNRIDLPGHVFEASDSSVVTLTTQVASDTIVTVTARAAGTSTVTVRVNDTRATSTIVVLPRVKSIVVKASPTQVLVGDSIVVSAAAIGWAGDTVPGQAITFSSSSPVATVSSTGRVTFTAPGTATITAKLGDLTATTVPLTALAREFIGGAATSFASGMDASCGLAPLGRVFCFGKAPVTGIARDTSCFGLPGSPGDPNACTLIPLPVGGGVQMTALAVGDSVACGIATGGKLYCWGDQKYGQVGNGVSKPATSVLPTPVTGPLAFAATFTQVTAGHTHACALTSTGAAYCWGRDTLFQAGGNGDNLNASSSTPSPAGGGITFKGISAGFAHTCGLRADGVAFCWGDDRSGQLGRDTLRTPSDTAMAVPGPVFTQISAGGNSTCGLTSVGTIYCWGAIVGTGTPVQIAGAGYTYLAVGGEHACAMSGGTVSCWGSNLYGQLGRGDLPSPGTVTPAPVSGARTYTVLTAGTHTSCAVAADGVYCWGSSLYGATGNQIQAIAVTTPQKVAPLQ